MPSHWSINVQSCCGLHLNSVWSCLPCCFPKGLQKWDFLDIYLTTVFRVRNFKNTSAIRVIFFFETFQNFIYIPKMSKKSWEKVFPFKDNCISIGYLKLSLLRRKYFWSAVNVLKNCPEILHITKRNLFEFNWLQSDQLIWYKWCYSDFSTVWSPLPCCLLKGPLTFHTFISEGFSDSVISEIHHYEGHLFLRVFKYLATFQKCREKLRKSSLFSR